MELKKTPLALPVGFMNLAEVDYSLYKKVNSRYFEMKKLLTLFTLISLALAASAQTEEQIVRIDEIKAQDSKYFFAESTSQISFSDAFNNALQDMARMVESRITVNISESNSRYDSETVIKSAVAFNNINKIEYSRENKGETLYTAFVYISKAECERQIREMQKQAIDRIHTLIEEGQHQEGKVNIADALRNFIWALQLSNYHEYKEKLPITDNRSVNLWLDDKIKSILESIEVALDNEKVEYDPMDYDHYTVNIKVTYADRPVSNLDIIYFNNEENREVNVKNGRAALKFPRLEGQNSIKFKIHYLYNNPEELEEDLVRAFQMGKKKSYDQWNTKVIPVTVNQDQSDIQADPDGDWGNINYEIAMRSDGIPPRVDPRKEEVERVFLEPGAETDNLLNVAKALEEALRKRDYSSVYSYFTPEALEKFQMMTNTGEISVSMTPVFKFEKASHYIRCTAIPVSIKNGKHSRNESMVLRFDPVSGKISSIAYALTDNAENDIFRAADWQMDSRYAIVKFMEDYQTAYTTKDKNYLDRIFNGDAIIITGTLQKHKGKGGKSFMEALESNNGPIVVSGVLYTSFTKNDYLANLERMFKKNNYIHLKYHNAELTRAVTPAFLSEAFWIELKQDFNSSSYNDKGYLTLQVGMKPEGSQIYVRTWTPNHLNLTEMKRRFPIDNFSHEL